MRARRRPSGGGRRGVTALEFAAGFFALTLLTVGSFDVVYPVFAQAAVAHAARAGVDLAIDGGSDVQAVRAAVLEGSLGLVETPEQVSVRYVDSLGSESTEPVSGGLVVVEVAGVPSARVLSGLWGADLLLGARAADLIP